MTREACYDGRQVRCGAVWGRNAKKNLGGVLLIIGKKRAARRTPAPPLHQSRNRAGF